MTRRWWWLGLGGAAAQAQTAAVCYHHPAGKLCKPANGQCPVCGAMAPKYDRIETAKHVNAVRSCAGTYASYSAGEYLADCRPITASQIETTRRIDCAHCNATFRQLAEDVKP